MKLNADSSLPASNAGPVPADNVDASIARDGARSRSLQLERTAGFRIAAGALDWLQLGRFAALRCGDLLSVRLFTSSDKCRTIASFAHGYRECWPAIAPSHGFRRRSEPTARSYPARIRRKRNAPPGLAHLEYRHRHE